MTMGWNEVEIHTIKWRLNVKVWEIGEMRSALMETLQGFIVWEAIWNDYDDTAHLPP